MSPQESKADLLPNGVVASRAEPSEGHSLPWLPVIDITIGATDESSTGVHSLEHDSLLRRVARAPAVSLAADIPLLPEPGEVVGDHFEIIRPLGQGGMARVYLGRDLNLGRLVAVKMIHLRRGSAGHRDRWLELFEREARTTARLSHPHIVTVFQYGRWNDLPFLVLELLQGESLADRLREGPLPVSEALEMASQVGQALVHAHARGILHRDLKPSNIWIQRDGSIKVLDFGLAQVKVPDEGGASDDGPLPAGAASDDGPLPAGGEPLEMEPVHGGTPAYMPPEQWLHQPQDGRTDVWALGLTLYESLTGSRPFETSQSLVMSAGSASSAPLELDQTLLSTLTPAVAQVLSRALELERDRRPAAHELVEVLQQSRGSNIDPERPGRDPYLYLESFTEADFDWFFGRDGEVGRLQRMLASRSLVAVIGPSGAGKSSLVQAGLIPRLRQNEALAALVLRPGADPLGALRERLLQACAPEARAHLEGSPHLLLERPGLVGRILRSYAARTGQKVLLVVDQLEELLTQVRSPEVRNAFAAALRSAADDAQSPVRVVVAFREDYLSRVAELMDLRNQVQSNLFLLAPPNAEAMAQALESPARRLGFEFEEGLVGEIIQDLSPYTAPLPILQFAASRLWEARDTARRLLTRDVLQSQGGIAGILVTHADQVIHQLAGEDVLVARELLCRLVTLEGTRCQLGQEELLESLSSRDRAERVLDHLILGRLLTSSNRDGVRWIELAHESLIAHWEQLQRWMNEDLELRLFRDRVHQAAVHWSERERADGLLWTGAILQEAQRWQRDYPEAFRGLDDDFLRAAVLFAQQARARRKHRIALLLGAAFLVTLASLALMAGYRTRAQEALAREQEAIEAGRVAQSTALAASSENAAASSNARSLKLAVMAVEKKPTLEAVDALRAALARPYVTTLLPGHESAAFSPDGQSILTWGGKESTAILWDRAGHSKVTLRGHSKPIQAAAFSPDGTLIATGSYDGTARLWTIDGQPRAILAVPGSSNLVRAVRFSPDSSRVLTSTFSGPSEPSIGRLWDLKGKLLAVLERGINGKFSPDGQTIGTGGYDFARLWDRDGRHPRTLGAPGEVNGVEFSPDGQLLTTAGADHAARIYTLDGRLKAVLGGHKAYIMMAPFSPDGQHIVTASRDYTARVWSRDGVLEAQLSGHIDGLETAVFSPDSQLILTTSADFTARLWSLDGELRGLLSGHQWWVGSGSFSPDGQTLLTAAGDNLARLWALDRLTLALLRGKGARFGLSGPAVTPAGPKERTWGLPEAQLAGWRVSDDKRWVNEVQPSRDGRLALTTADTRVARLWNLTTGDPAAVLEGHSGWVSNATFSPDSRWIVTGGTDGTARLWDGSGKPLRVLEGHQDAITSSSFSPDGERVLTTSQDGTARVWTRAGQAVSVLTGHRGAVNDGAFSPNGRLVATASSDQTARLWDLEGHLKATLEPHAGEVTKVLFSADGRRILTRSDENAVRLWDRNGRLLSVIRGTGERLLDGTFSPDSQLLITSSDGETPRLWDRDGEARGELKGHEDRITHVTFSPDGQLILTTSLDKTARVWDRTGRARAVLKGHDHWVVDGCFSPDGQKIVTASFDHTARLWDLEGHLLSVLRGHDEPVTRALFSPDGRYIHSWSREATLISFPVRTEDLLEQARKRLTPEILDETRRHFGAN